MATKTWNTAGQSTFDAAKIGFAGTTWSLKDLFSSTVLMLYLNGLDGATATTDSSPSNHAITFHGNAELDTAQKKFGVSSCLFPGAFGDRLSIGDSNDWDFGTSDFSIITQTRFNVLSSGNWYTLIDMGGFALGVRLLLFYHPSGGYLQVYIKGTGYTFSWIPSTAQWYQVALTRSGSDLRLFINGNQADTTKSDSSNITGLTAGVAIGGRVTADVYWLNGWQDGIRIEKGNALYTANFTPPSTEYTRYETTSPEVGFNSFTP